MIFNGAGQHRAATAAAAAAVALSRRDHLAKQYLCVLFVAKLEMALFA